MVMCKFKNLSKMLIMSSLLFVSFSLSAQNANEKPTPLIDGHEYVDLGLSVKWATCNIGATSIIQHGNLYAWGEIDTKSKYSKETYKYLQIEKVQKNVEYFLFKNIGDNISGDNRYDVAKSCWGGHWRLPSADEVKELIDNCTYEWGTLNGVTGALFISKKNGNSIFLPAGGEELYGKGTGNELGSLLHGGGVFGSYWTGTIANGCRDLTHVNDLGFAMEVRSANASCNKNYREYGFSVRAVADMRINGHEYVDLGLSVGWASCNLGAESPTDDGNVYAWGETRANRDYYSQKNYEHYNRFIYNDIGSNISGNYSYDAARKEWGGSWRMPTETEISELLENCTFEWVTRGDVKGALFTSKKNGNSIFLPAAGQKSGRIIWHKNRIGIYLSGSLGCEPSVARTLDLQYNPGARLMITSREGGSSIRPVVDLPKTQQK